LSLTFEWHRNVTLFNTSTSNGVSIPYPAISLHALQTAGDSPDPPSRQLYMQLEFVDGVADEEDPEILELSLLSIPDEDMQKLYDAVSTCSNLHPDNNGDVDIDVDEDGDSRIVFEGSVGYDGVSGLPGVQQGVSFHDLVSALPAQSMG
jgi:nucleotide-sensitive chloride channel 1A